MKGYPRKCSCCNGTGYLKDIGRECLVCGGTGEIVISEDKRDGRWMIRVRSNETCRTCKHVDDCLREEYTGCDNDNEMPMVQD
jgi:DnaJ-class molecular chaperone